MLQPAKLSSLLDISDELRRDVCQLMFLSETIPFLFTQEVDQDIIEGMSSIIYHILGSLNNIEDRLKQINTVSSQEQTIKREKTKVQSKKTMIGDKHTHS